MEASAQHTDVESAPSANPQNTPLLYNIVATTTSQGDGLATMNVQFSLNNQLLWATVVSQNNPDSTTNTDQSFGSVKIDAGSTVSLVQYGALVLVRFSGTLTSGPSTTTLSNAPLAKFQLNS